MRFAIVLVLAAAHGALAQRPSRTLKGSVVDSADHKPLSQVAIHLDRMITGQRTGNDGTFRVSADTDVVWLMLRRPGYVPVLIGVPEGAAASETDVGTIAVRQVKTDDDRAAVENVDQRVYPELRQFYDRKARYHNGAVFLAPDDLNRVGGSLFSYIRQKAGFHFLCYVTQHGEWDCGEQRSRGRTSIMNPNPRSAEQERCPLSLWFNSVGVGPQKTLDQIQMSEVLAVEAYPNPGATPAEFAGSPCATIMLWMDPTSP